MNRSASINVDVASVRFVVCRGNAEMKEGRVRAECRRQRHTKGRIKPIFAFLRDAAICATRLRTGDGLPIFPLGNLGKVNVKFFRHCLEQKFVPPRRTA